TPNPHPCNLDRSPPFESIHGPWEMQHASSDSSFLDRRGYDAADGRRLAAMARAGAGRQIGRNRPAGRVAEGRATVVVVVTRLRRGLLEPGGGRRAALHPR